MEPSDLSYVNTILMQIVPGWGPRMGQCKSAVFHDLTQHTHIADWRKGPDTSAAGVAGGHAASQGQSKVWGSGPAAPKLALCPDEDGPLIPLSHSTRPHVITGLTSRGSEGLGQTAARRDSPGWKPTSPWGVDFAECGASPHPSAVR